MRIHGRRALENLCRALRVASLEQYLTKPSKWCGVVGSHSRGPQKRSLGVEQVTFFQPSSSLNHKEASAERGCLQSNLCHLDRLHRAFDRKEVVGEAHRVFRGVIPPKAKQAR